MAYGEPLAPDQADIATVAALRERLLGSSGEESPTNTAPCSSAIWAKRCIRGLKKNRSFRARPSIDGMRPFHAHARNAAGGGHRAGAAHAKPPCRASEWASSYHRARGRSWRTSPCCSRARYPVSLNFAAGRGLALKSAMRRAEIDTVITAKIVEKQDGAFPVAGLTFCASTKLLPPLKKEDRPLARIGRGHPVVGD